MNILIGADIVPTISNREFFINGDMEKIIENDLYDLIMNSDYRIFNLETPLTDIEDHIVKRGPHLIAPISTINGLVALNVDVVALANNHILDQGVQGLDSTIRVLDKNGILHAGAGAAIEEARKPVIFKSEKKRIGIYACAEHEFSIVKKDRAGANPFDPLETLDQISTLKEECDFVIVLYHGGKEHYRYPTPMLQKACRKMIEKGANLIICQHSHCIGCEETYNGGRIIYGQGNFLFDHNNHECWETGLLVRVSDGFQIEYIPVVKAGNGVRLTDSVTAKRILDDFYRRSEQIKKENFVEDEFLKLAKTYRKNMMLELLGVKRGIGYRIMNRLLCRQLDEWIINKKLTPKYCSLLQNFIECETHRELLLKITDILNRKEIYDES